MNRTLVTPLVASFVALGATACDTILDYTVGAGSFSDSGSHLVATDSGCATPDDPKNCGACGHSCLGGACIASVCQPVVLASGQGNSIWDVPWIPYTNDNGDLVGPDRIAVDGSDVYWLNLRGEVMRVPIGGGPTTRVAATQSAPAWIELDDEFVYFSTLERAIFRVPKAGGTPVLLVPASTSSSEEGPLGGSLPTQPYPLEFMLSSGGLQWADGTGVYSCPVTGCAGATRATVDPGGPGSVPFSFAIDTSGEQYASVADVQEAGVPAGFDAGDGGGDSFTVSFALTFLQDGQFLGLAGQTVYYELHGGAHEVYALATTELGATGVVRWTPTSETYLASGVPAAPRSLALDETSVYWVNATPPLIDVAKRTASVVRCAKAGCASPEVLAADQLVPRAVAVGSGAVYWTTGDGKVWKLALPGGPTTGSP
jgi:hypothetical protein